MLSVNNLRVSYGMSEVIHDLCFEVGSNETLAIMGRNGMGKTTLFKSLIGVLPCRGGNINMNGKDMAAMKSFQRVEQGVAYVPQGRMIFPTLTVQENIETGLEVTGKKKVPDDIYELFPVLLEMRHRKGGNLSGGQQQQLAIARALAANPKVLLLDEPTEGIQPSIIKQLAKTLNDIKKIRKLSIVVSEQVLSFATEVADRVLVIDKGRFVHESVKGEFDTAKISRYLSV